MTPAKCLLLHFFYCEKKGDFTVETVDKQYLTLTIESLQRAYRALTADLQQQDTNFKDLQKYMIDYKSELDKFEVYDYQQTLHMLDKQGFAQKARRAIFICVKWSKE